MAQAFVRSLKIKNQQYLTKQKAHAHRKDTTNEVRPGAEPGMALVWAPPGLPEGGIPRTIAPSIAFPKDTAVFQSGRARRSACIS
ncbi:hypothetical protein [Microvirga aerophila]|uniref:Uncharacterized protein n=1 Tax=Microvirga aerophila TaxID=670291 RepID=A0A512C4S3_9HYPH|nr:hypothetical protein [Microvirga aerophila]GEO19160.1 hypothetical protein MAE02_68560 [Microvirga aerophila]